MKKVIGFLIACIGFVNLQGQSVVLENLPSFGSSIDYLGEGYAFTKTGKKDDDKNRDFQIKYYNRQLENDVVISFKISNSQGEREMLFNGKHFLTVFEDVKEKKYVYYVHDTEGNEIGKKEDIINKSNESVPIVKYIDETGFFFFRSIKGDKWGYLVERVDAQLNTLWTYKYIPERGYVDFSRPYVNEHGIALLEIVPNRKAQASVGRVGKVDKDFFNLVMINRETGELTGKYNLAQSGDFLEPTSIAIDKDQSVLLGGMYFSNAGDNKDNSTGTYIAKISPTGEEAFVNKLPWADATNNLQEFLASGKKKKKKGITFTPKVRYHHISSVNGKYYLIGEVFQKAVSAIGMAGKFAALADKDASDDGPSGIAINILDFLVLTFDDHGQLINKALASKNKRTVYQEDNSTRTGGMTESAGLDFDYRFMSQRGTKDTGVVFMGTEMKNFIEKKYFGYFDLEHSGESIEVKRIPFKMSGKLMDGEIKLEIYPHSENKVLKYEYYRDKSRLFMDVIDFKVN